MCQRICVALSFALEPDLLIADEITSALDRKSQDELIQLLITIKNTLKTGILFITHDLRLARQIADRILFLKQCRFEEITLHNEENSCKAVPRCRDKARRCSTLLDLAITSKYYDSKLILKDLSFQINTGEIFGILGESGCGKSTLARLLSGIEGSYTGEISFNGQRLAEKQKSAGRYFYKDIQIIFQNERACLNPYEKIISIVEAAIKNLRRDCQTPRELAKRSLAAVGLDESLYMRRSGNLSTGQCQRVSIARAIAVEPQLMILDEVVSALDVSSKRGILELLAELQAKLDIAMLMISHEIDVLQTLCQRVALMRNGTVEEIIDVDDRSLDKMKKFLMES
ncbi:MAG: ATP-binding cassette domain-containing protein [Eubacteriales bacterium]|nr:ATP-binding cassette domain-containing protein [Eubacteriales bacterium]